MSCTLALKSQYNRPKAFQRHIWDYKSTNIPEFKKKLYDTDFDECFTFESIEKISESWTFLNVARQYIPNKVVTVRMCDKAFFTSELRKLRRKKNHFHQRAKCSNNAQHWELFRNIRNTYNDKIKEAKLVCEKKKAAFLQDQNNRNSKKWWQLAKSFIQKDSNKSSYPPIKVGNAVICDDKEKAESFNSFFLEHANLDDSNTPRPTQTDPIHTLSEIHILPKDVLDLIKCLKISKASGPDEVSHAMLKGGVSIVKYKHKYKL